MRISTAFAAFLLAWLALPAAGYANVVAKIDISEQRLHLYVNGARHASWPVSTGRGRYRTPTGTFSVKSLHRHHYSSRYNNAPMPHSVFFHRGYAIHGTDQIRYLGRPASHGCVRLHPRNAAVLYNLIRRHGSGSARITVTH